MQLRESDPISQQAYIAELYRRYWLMILSDVLQHVPTREDAEDVLHEQKRIHPRNRLCR